MVAALMYRLDVGGRVGRLRWRLVGMLLMVWIGIGAARGLSITSDFMTLTERLAFISVYVLSSLWMLWFWIPL